MVQWCKTGQYCVMLYGIRLCMIYRMYRFVTYIEIVYAYRPFVLSCIISHILPALFTHVWSIVSSAPYWVCSLLSCVCWPCFLLLSGFCYWISLVLLLCRVLCLDCWTVCLFCWLWPCLMIWILSPHMDPTLSSSDSTLQNIEVLHCVMLYSIVFYCIIWYRIVS